ncbi:MAG TPA: glutaminyl-peptide cyclotransferase, partial [Pyrinomonadaceae bacterium]|nr:glutaminyl-peptide cyclotransferase [Pyrinomonadaceae bacterium]
MRIYLLFSVLILLFGCGPATPSNNNNNAAVNNTKKANSVPKYGFEIVKSYPHDGKAFTQGLVFDEGFLYEGTGELGESTLRKVDLASGKVVLKHELPDEVFGEGITILGDEIFQFSWRNRMGWVYNLADFKLLREFTYQGEGWGMTNDGTNIFISDGTHVIRVVNPADFKTTRTISVKDEAGRLLMKLNELEWVKGEIWANIWHSEEIGKPNHIARIDPADGKLLGWIDLGGISPDDQNDEDESENTLNGIAYDPATDRIFVTG